MLTTTAILNYYYELDFTSQNSLQVLSPRQIRGKLNYGPFPGANSEHKSALGGRRNLGLKGGGMIPQILNDELTLSQSGGRSCPPYYYSPPRIFRPSYGSTLWCSSKAMLCTSTNSIENCFGLFWCSHGLLYHLEMSKHS